MIALEDILVDRQDTLFQNHQGVDLTLKEDTRNMECLRNGF